MMRFPLRSVFSMLFSAGLLGLLAGPSAAARKSVEVQEFRPGAASPKTLGTPVPCTMGVDGDRGLAIAFLDVVRQPDNYYTLLRIGDCDSCETADTAIVSRVHLVLYYPSRCPLPISIGLATTLGRETCPVPYVGGYTYGPSSFTLPAANPGDTLETVFTLDPPAVVVGKAFLVVSFLDTVAGCRNFEDFPKLVLRYSDRCDTCRSYNDWCGVDESPDDLCYPFPGSTCTRVGLPLMWAEVDQCYPLEDHTAPATVTNLAQDSLGATGARLTWTAPGDDSLSGLASAYDLRRSPSPILTMIDFQNADSLTDVPFPGPPQSTERYRATGLSEHTTYHFALQTDDGNGNSSGISNSVAVTTPIAPPAQVAGLTILSASDTQAQIRWTATGDDGISGRPARYFIAVGSAPLTDANFFSGRVDSVSATADYGSFESTIIGGLVSARSYYVAIKARDDVGGISVVSASVLLQTQLRGQVSPAVAPRTVPSKLPVALDWLGFQGATGQKIRIYDLGGRLIRTMQLDAVDRGVTVWDGKNDDGVDVPSGLYVARLSTSGGEAKARVVLLK